MLQKSKASYIINVEQRYNKKDNESIFWKIYLYITYEK